MVPKNMETEEEKLEQFGKWTKEFKAEDRRFTGKVLRPYSSFGKQLHELVKSYLVPTHFKMQDARLEMLVMEVLRDMYSAKDLSTVRVSCLENIPPISISLLNAKVLKIRSIFPHSVMQNQNDGYSGSAKDVEWLESSIIC